MSASCPPRIYLVFASLKLVFLHTSEVCDLSAADFKYWSR